MANPRRTSHTSNQLPISDPNPPFQFQFQSQTHQSAASLLITLKTFLKKPLAFPFLLSVFLLLTWVSLRFQHSSHNPSFRLSSYNASDKAGGYFKDPSSSLVKFPSTSPLVMKDKRGWMVDPVSLALDAGIPGGAVYCASIHVGEIRPGSMRGNHRHHTCNETLVLWGARTLFRLENKSLPKGYSETAMSSDEVLLVASASGTAHALMNRDPVRSTFFLGCQDSVINYNATTSDFNVWKDL